MSDEIRFEEEDYNSKVSRGTLLRVLSSIRPHWKWAVGFLVAISIVSIIEASFNLISMRIIDEALIPNDRERLIELILIYGGMHVVFVICIFAFIALAGILGQRVMYDLRKAMFEHMQTLSFTYFDKTPIGWLMSRVTSDSNRMADLVTWGLLDITWATLNIVTALFFMATINWQLALLVMAMLPVLIYVAIWFKTRILVEFRRSRKLNSKITGTYNENITGVRIVKAHRREEMNLKEFDDLSLPMYQSSFRAAWLSALFLPVVQIISSIGVMAVVWYGGLQVGEGITIGGIQAFVSYITFMMWPIEDMSRVYASMQQSIASAERVFSLLDEEPDLTDKPNSVDPGTIIGDITFDNVTFYYEPVLKNFNLTVKQGETIALVGPTGHGKSTIVNLICRFYEPREGVIKINGQDYTTMPMSAIHSRIGMVLQTPHLFSGTIRENIRYGRLDASDDEVLDAAKLAGAHPFIQDLEKGYDEQVGEGGVLLSVGQKQLISLARAVLSKPELFIMDEATSSVDTLTEALIQQGMDTLMEGRTSFVIAHRLSTIKRADRIIVIQHGEIAEMGTHAELLRERGHYYELYTQQFKAEREAQLEADTPQLSQAPIPMTH
jgi:ATP-binding cassette subfamily B protein